MTYIRHFLNTMGLILHHLDKSYNYARAAVFPELDFISVAQSHLECRHAHSSQPLAFPLASLRAAAVAAQTRVLA
jgi:hypothetical protein